MKTSTLILIYKRPELTNQVIDSLRKIKPKDVYVVADGAKDKREKKLCDETRDLIDKIDWDCRIHKKYASKNLGLRKRVSSGITWFFKNVNQGIVLEDDCVADLSFFRFCEKLLERYKNSRKIMAISGDNFLQGKKVFQDSYYYSKYPHCWGWASWNRAWKLYDDDMKDWPKLKKSGWLHGILKNKLTEIYWKNIFDLVYKEKINSWAYRWQYSCWLNKGLTIIPKVNLVRNIGQGMDASNTKLDLKSNRMQAGKLVFPLKHPQTIKVDSEADLITERNKFINIRNFTGAFYKKYFS